MSNKEVIYTYEVNPSTVAILSNEKENGTLNTVILEENREYTGIQTPTKMIDLACKYYGSSLRGRKLIGVRKIN